MAMDEINPNHPVTRSVHDQWHKIAALLMHKFGQRSVEITIADIQNAFEDPQGINICIKDDAGKLTVFLISNEEAQRIARKEGGLPV